MSRLKPRLAITVGLAVAFVALSCKIRQVETEPEPPPRPKGVPERAIWAGGLDGGSFIVLESTSVPNRYSAAVYDENTGEVVFKGTLSLDMRPGERINVKDPKILDTWDGDTLYLTDGRSLSPVPQ
jgi:hypothetical protein